MSAAVPLLLVDDDATNRLTLSALLEAEGFEVVTASSMREAWDATSGRVFAAALVDRRLGGEDGLELAAELRASAASSAVFILSGDAPEAGTPRGIDGWLLKGTSTAEIIGRIRAALPADAPGPPEARATARTYTACWGGQAPSMRGWVVS